MYCALRSSAATNKNDCEAERRNAECTSTWVGATR